MLNGMRNKTSGPFVLKTCKSTQISLPITMRHIASRPIALIVFSRDFLHVSCETILLTFKVGTTIQNMVILRFMNIRNNLTLKI